MTYTEKSECIHLNSNGDDFKRDVNRAKVAFLVFKQVLHLIQIEDICHDEYTDGFEFARRQEKQIALKNEARNIIENKARTFFEAVEVAKFFRKRRCMRGKRKMSKMGQKHAIFRKRFKRNIKKRDPNCIRDYLPTFKYEEMACDKSVSNLHRKSRTVSFIGKVVQYRQKRRLHLIENFTKCGCTDCLDELNQIQHPT